MSSFQPPQAAEIIDTTESDDTREEEESDNNAHANDAGSSTGQPSKKKKKKKSKIAKALGALSGKPDIPQAVIDRVLDEVKAAGIGDEEATEENIQKALEKLKIMDVVQGKAGIGGLNKKDMGGHKFWGTQPVPQPGEGPPIEDGFIEPPKPVEELRQEPYPLPDKFEWSTLDMDDPAQIKEVYDLLCANYVEDDIAAFRFQYTAEFIHWALCPPGYHKKWHVGVRVSANKKLVAFISGVPITLRVRKNIVKASEINYLCVHKKLRSKRLTPVLIKEVTRQVNLKGIFQAIYTAGVVVPTPLSVCRYYHRSLNVPKLVDIKFSHVPRNMTLARLIRVSQVPEKPSLHAREIEDKDVVPVTRLFTEYMRRFDMVPIMDIEEVRHQLLSGKGTGKVGDGGPGRRTGQVTWTYVVEHPETHQITDFFSFYSLPSTIIGNQKYGTLEAAYLFYYATDVSFDQPSDQGDKLKDRVRDIISDAIIIANNAKFDVFNALTLMDNVPVLENLKFGVGDGFLNFYLYNWRTAPLAGMVSAGGVPAGKGVGVVML